MAVEIAGIKCYTIEDVAAELECSTFTIKNYIKGGGIVAKKINNKWYITEENLQNYIKGQDNKIGGKVDA